MARRETGAWLPISAVVVGLALYGFGIVILALDKPISIQLFIFSSIGILVGPYLPWIACLLSNPWRRYHQAAFFFGSIPLFGFLAVCFWEFDKHQIWPVSVCILILSLEAWVGSREFLKVRKAMLAAKETRESH
jgi:hypothetical protein